MLFNARIPSTYMSLQVANASPTNLTVITRIFWIPRDEVEDHLASA